MGIRAVFAAGGTAGHINPALSIAKNIKSRFPDSEILFIGREDGMEKALVKKEGFDLIEIKSHGFMRKLTLEDIIFNIKSFFNIFAAAKAAGKVLKKFKPDIVIGCGGYISGPVLRKAAKMGYKTAIQEQNSYPGLTNRLLAKDVDLILACDEICAESLGQPKKTVITGNPVDEDFFSIDKSEAGEKLGAKGRFTVLSFGGSLGASKINEIAAGFMKLHYKSDKILHIHATGRYEAKSFYKRLGDLYEDIKNSGNVVIKEFIDEMPLYLSAADVVISRAGAITLSEIKAVGRASVLIPSPNVTENHQYKNAVVLRDAGAALVFEEKDADADIVAKELLKLSENRALAEEMGENAGRLAVKNTNEIILDLILKLINED
ncbi:MAG: undecaprenyldiphospho-muramoylpentapeptide beta-N-acetylglucosaminyltransferase [Ruminococcaceae bacterium]|nr:undecaprenyldiphospho-muramoylpentapeptide beta-N-acetylglucosaminyltransferase [Oscillospiraceae bacterium]